MNIHETKRTDSFKRIKVFGTENAADFPVGSKGAMLFAALNTRIINIDAASIVQTSAKSDVRQDYAGKGTARENLRAICASISRTSAGASYEIPGLDVKFYLPVDLTDAELLAHGKMLLKDAPEHKEKLIEWGEDEDFLEDLAEATAAFENAASHTSADLGEQIEATADISEEVRQGMINRRQLNVIVRNRYKNDTGKLTAWEKAYHIEYPKKKKETEKPTVK